jgi:predicted exporter
MLAVFLSAVTTILSFGLLALSETTVIHSFGLTLWVGIAVAFLLSPLVIAGTLINRPIEGSE